MSDRLDNMRFTMNVHAKSLSHVWLFVTPWTVPYQAPLFMEFSRQEYGRGYHFLLQGIFPSQGLNPCLLCLLHWQVGSLPLVLPGKPFSWIVDIILLVISVKGWCREIITCELCPTSVLMSKLIILICIVFIIYILTLLKELTIKWINIFTFYLVSSRYTFQSEDIIISQLTKCPFFTSYNNHGSSHYI